MNTDPQHWFWSVWWIRIRLFSIPNSGSKLSPYRIVIKEFKCFNPQKSKKWFLSFKKYDPGCSSRIPDPDCWLSPIPDPGSRGQKGTQSRIRIRNSGIHKKERIFGRSCERKEFIKRKGYSGEQRRRPPKRTVLKLNNLWVLGTE